MGKKQKPCSSEQVCIKELIELLDKLDETNHSDYVSVKKDRYELTATKDKKEDWKILVEKAPLTDDSKKESKSGSTRMTVTQEVIRRLKKKL